MISEKPPKGEYVRLSIESILLKSKYHSHAGASLQLVPARGILISVGIYKLLVKK